MGLPAFTIMIVYICAMINIKQDSEKNKIEREKVGTFYYRNNPLYLRRAEWVIKDFVDNILNADKRVTILLACGTDCASLIFNTWDVLPIYS